MELFPGFTIDTLIGCIGCILSIVGLVIGTKAYKKCKFYEQNDHKKYNDNSSDNSQRASGDIINYNCDAELVAHINSENINMLSYFFERYYSQNIQMILDQTNRIIQEQRIIIAGFSKIDWINIYFEGAKNASDEYMQKVWSKVLAKELEIPGTFCYKTLDVLKNMSADDFACFERLCALEIEGYIFQEDIHSKYGVSYMDLVKLSEFGLVTVNNSEQTITLDPHDIFNIKYCDYIIAVENTEDVEIQVKYAVFLLTSAARELLKVASYVGVEEYIKECADYLSQKNKRAKISLRSINYQRDNEMIFNEQKARG